MQNASSRIWTPVTVSISFDDNHYHELLFTASEIWEYVFSQQMD